MEDSTLRIDVLGPLEVAHGPTVLKLPQSKKARALLAYLAITGRPHTRSRLCDLFWDVADDPRAGLRWCLSRLRRITNSEHEILVADRTSVGLATTHVTTDIRWVTKRLGAPTPIDATELRRMASLFRGELLDGLDQADLHGVQAWLIAQRSEARQLHRRVLERLVATLDHPDEAIPAARQLVLAAPEVESSHVCHVRLLLEAGRNREAEQQYQAGLRELEAHGVGTHALRLAWRRASSERSPKRSQEAGRALGGETQFVGRVTEQLQLEQRIKEAVGGRGGVATVSGEPGIGKTRLLQEVRRRAEKRGVRVVQGACASAAYAIPYLPFIEALDAPAMEVPGELLGPHLAVLDRLLPTLSQGRPEEAAGGDTPSEADRYAVFRGVAQLLAALASDHGLVLMLEDMHWADTQSLLMLGYLARLLGDQRVLIIATYRDVEVVRTHPLRDALVSLQREPNHTRLSLKRLSETASVEMIAGLADVDARVVRAIQEKTEGHPLFIEEVVKHLREEGRVGGATDTPPMTSEPDYLGLPEGVRDVIGRRLSKLSDACNKMLACASAFTNTIPWPVLVVVCGGDEDELLDHLDEALHSEVLRERPTSGAGSYEFTHALIRQALYEELSSSRRLRLHRKIAEGIEDLYRARLTPHLVELAHHYFHAAPRGEIDKFVHYSIAAGEHATSVMAFEEAARLYDRALRTIDDLEAELPQEQRSRLHELHGRALASMNQWPDALVEFQSALGHIPTTDEFNRARLLLHSAVCEFWMLDIERVRVLAREALGLAESAKDNRLVAGATGMLAQTRYSDGNVEKGASLYEQAHRLAGDSMELLVGQTLQQYPISLYWSGQFDAAESAGRDLVRLARSGCDGSMVMNVLSVMAMSASCAGRYAESAALFAQAEQFGRDHGIHRLLARAACMQSAEAIDLGALDYAHERAELALEAALSADFAPSVMSTRLDLLLLAIARHQLSAAEALLPTVRETIATTRGFHLWVWKLRVALAEAQMTLGRGDAEATIPLARELIAEARRTGRVKYVAQGAQLLGRAFEAAGDVSAATDAFRHACTAARTIRYPALLINAAGDLLRVTDAPEIASAARDAVHTVSSALEDKRLRRALDDSDAVARILAVAG